MYSYRQEQWQSQLYCRHPYCPVGATRFGFLHKAIVGRDSSVGIATLYWLIGPWIEYRCGARFPVPVQTGPGTHPASYTMGAGSFSAVKRPGRGVGHPSSAEIKERVELYFLLPLCAFVACSRVNFTVTINSSYELRRPAAAALSV